MQPYFLPYIGYFQLIAEVDKFILLDDVAFIKRGWINRNRILVNGQVQYITFPVVDASQNRMISKHELMQDDGWKLRIEKTITMAYSKAPQFNRFMAVFKDILYHEAPNLSAYILYSLDQLCHYMNLKSASFAYASDFGTRQLNGQERILDICQKSSAIVYCNLPGGKSLYSSEAFSESGIHLCFLTPEQKNYLQQKVKEFIPGLSIIDLLMNCDVQEVNEQLKCYRVD